MSLFNKSPNEEMEKLKNDVYVLKLQVEDLKQDLFVVNSVCQKKEYRVLYRHKLFLNGYDGETHELRKMGWHIDRVSDDCKYEIWMPHAGEVKS